MWSKVGLMLLSIIPAIICEECTPLTAKAELDLKQMEGWWYLQYKSGHDDAKDMLRNYKCMRQNWSVNPDGSLTIVHTGINSSEPRTSDGKTLFVNGRRTTTDGNIDTHIWQGGKETVIPTQIIDTDYKNFMVTTVCTKDIQYQFLYSRREEEMNAEDIKAVQPMLEAAKLTIDKMKLLPHSECP